MLRVFADARCSGSTPMFLGVPGPPRTVVVVRSLVSMDDQNLLGAYLRARRELVSPEQVGIAPVGIRRVPGLRREEVALLAGISADYYLRLEQGRDRSPSRQVLDALARVLHLDDEGTAYLQSLADPRPHRTRKRPRPEVVPRGIHALISTLDLPAFVEGRYLDVLFSRRTRQLRRCLRAWSPDATGCATCSSIPANASSTGLPSWSPLRWSQGSDHRWDSMSRMNDSWNSSGACRSPARGFARSGRDRTSCVARARSSRSPIPKSET